MNKVMYKLLFKIPLIKKWYIGNEMLKNPPTVYLEEGGVVNGISFKNVTFNGSRNGEIKNCTFESTLKLSQYFSYEKSC